MILPICDGHPVKRVIFATEVNDDKSRQIHYEEPAQAFF
jgi:hypothetical protein